MTRSPWHVQVDGARLAADRWPGPGPTLVLLHAGVADRRGWYPLADRLAGLGEIVAYDRRGFGGTPPPDRPYRDVDDLVAVLDALGDGRAWLIGNSMGGRIALDLATLHPDRVAGLVLLAPAVSGAPEDDPLDPATERLGGLLAAAAAAGDLDELARLEAWLWLDGPAGPEGRVGGAVRDLALAMNAIALRNDVDDAAADAGTRVWDEPERVRAPATVLWGDRDVPVVVAQCEQLVARLPRATGQVVPGVAHLAALEAPDRVADLVVAAVR